MARRKNKRKAKSESLLGLSGVQWAGVAAIVVVFAVAFWYFISRLPVVR